MFGLRDKVEDGFDNVARDMRQFKRRLFGEYWSCLNLSGIPGHINWEHSGKGLLGEMAHELVNTKKDLKRLREELSRLEYKLDKERLKNRKG